MKEACHDGEAARLAARVQELEAELAQLSYAVSHDVRAPLRAVGGFADALVEDFGPTLDPAARKYAERISAAARRMDAMLQALLAYSRLSRSELRAGPVELSPAVSEALQPYADRITAGDAVVTVEEPLPRVVADRTLLVQALVALFDNALKFCEPGAKPKVRVYAEPAGEAVRLWIEDNGIGVAAEHREKIFGLFERLHTADRYPGPGMGLALARRALGRINGRIGVESAEPGARFWIELPRG